MTNQFVIILKKILFFCRICYKVYIQNPQYNSPACLIVSPVSRKIVIDTNSTFIRDKLDILYDLIKDDLVEKVKEKD